MISLPLFEHQKVDVATILRLPRVLNWSDPGTGKTRTAIEAIKRFSGRTLVVCPKSIMRLAWEADVRKFGDGLKCAIAEAPSTTRKEVFTSDAEIVVLNHDGIKWVANNMNVLDGFENLVVDESTAFKNACDRTAKMVTVAQKFGRRILMTGTPYTNSILDVWRQVFICDDGARLGKNFYRFRAETCKEKILPNGIRTWEDRPGMETIVATMLRDICIRHTLDTCLDIPQNMIRTIEVQMGAEQAKRYKELERTATLMVSSGQVTALNAAVLFGKLLQLLSGAVYTDTGGYEVLDPERYELVAELADERKQCVIAFNWRHQKDTLLKMIKDSAVIDGDTPPKERVRIVEAFQAGKIRNILVHPQTGAHGITLTAGTTTIWTSPSLSAERFTQFNHRIHRAGQTKKTETILIAASNSVETRCYERLQSRLTTGYNLLEVLK